VTLDVIFFVCFALLLAAHTSLSPYDLCSVMIYCDLCVTMSLAPFNMYGFSLLKLVKFSFLFSLICYWFYHSSE